MARQEVKAPKGTYVVVTSRFNEFITRRLLDGCVDELQARGVAPAKIRTVWVPGAFELPVVALKCARRKDVAAVICLGAVIRGETYHFELVSRGAAEGIMQAGLLTGKPVIFGVITTDTVDQAYKRSQEKGENKGREAAEAALDMTAVLRGIRTTG